MMLTPENTSLLFFVKISFRNRSCLGAQSNSKYSPSTVQYAKNKIAQELHLNLINVMYR